MTRFVEAHLELGETTVRRDKTLPCLGREGRRIVFLKHVSDIRFLRVFELHLLNRKHDVPPLVLTGSVSQDLVWDQWSPCQLTERCESLKELLCENNYSDERDWPQLQPFLAEFSIDNGTHQRNITERFPLRFLELLWRAVGSEKLLIQQAALYWLKVKLVELSYSGMMAQSITLTYWEKALKRRAKTLYSSV